MELWVLRSPDRPAPITPLLHYSRCAGPTVRAGERDPGLLLDAAPERRRMAQTYRVGIIGCGLPRSHEAATGFGMSHAHARGFEGSGQCDLACVADISR